ncbi:hypothetical protein Pcinc_013838 [Petrolisthes cinctipes]|uniref:Cytoplasmic dynein 2 light intermediate chain 1 n=1 Tax=Petrolisthes cinctipes TaxID=88211 RepID=A0AAE1KTX4_PETCI|nr:hypothetical protein Pcinc_013838 [Petrolisthes cinctipes]
MVRVSSSSSGRGDTSSGSGLSVWDLAVVEARGKRQERAQNATQHSGDSDKAPREATLIFVGPRSAGKTTLLQRFLDREEVPRHTLALEYTYGRKTGRTLVKDVCHLWEVGGSGEGLNRGGGATHPLLSPPLTPRSLPSLTVVLLVDLSRPRALWKNLMTTLRQVKEAVNKAVERSPGAKERLEALAALRVTSAVTKGPILEGDSVGDGGDDGDDGRGEVDPFPVPLVLMGGKYDIFQDFQPEEKKLICRALRYVAHTNGATLQFFSAKDPGLVKKAKELLGHFAFGTAESRSLSQDYNKPLIIPAGSDSLEAICQGEKHDLQSWGRALETRYVPEEGEEDGEREGGGGGGIPEDPARDPTYAEHDVDNLRAQKDEELERIRREVGRSSTRWAELDLP